MKVLALRPELVQEPRPHRDEPPGSYPRTFAISYRAEFHGSWQRMDGYTDSPDRADGARGRAYLEAAIRGVGAAFVEFYQATTRIQA